MWKSVADVNDNLLFEMPEQATECALLLGAKSASGSIARAAARLYHKGLFNKLVISGGQLVFQPLAYIAAEECNMETVSDTLYLTKEAKYMQSVLMQNGVPCEMIVGRDTKSKNTGENFRNVRSLLEAFNSITMVTVAYHQRRALGTALKVMGDQCPALTAKAVYPFGLTDQNWSSSLLSKFVWQEAVKVDPENTDPATSYIAKGFCVDVDVDQARKGMLDPNGFLLK
jgi:uncharacterized SAM-binding protein YcdF (DUF218 family)